MIKEMFPPHRGPYRSEDIIHRDNGPSVKRGSGSIWDCYLACVGKIKWVGRLFQGGGWWFYWYRVSSEAHIN